MRSEVWIAEGEGAPPKVTFIKRVAEIWRDQGLDVQHFAAATSPAGDLVERLEAGAKAVERHARKNDCWPGDNDYDDAAGLLREAAQALRHQSTGVTEITDEMVERVRERYTPEPVPPCPVCGEALSIQSAGGGRATVYGCSHQPFDLEHYQRSRWTQYRPGDPQVLALLDALAPTAAITAQERG